MKHGLKLRKLQRTSSHRYALLRNLVSALLHHEVIKTTVPKAKEAARMAEKIISLGKRGTDPAKRKAQAFLMPGHHYTTAAFAQPVAPPLPPTADPEADPEAFSTPHTLLPKVFTTLADRYQERPGGYTRIQKYGRRPGDHAPVAVVSLVDGPRDLKYEMTARACARETVGAMRTDGYENIEKSKLRPRTGQALEKVLKYRSEEEKEKFYKKSQEFANLLFAEEKVVGHRRKGPDPEYQYRPHSRTIPQLGRRILAGERLPGMSTAHTGLGLARGALGRRAERRDATPLFAGEKRQVQQQQLDVD